MRTVSIVVRLRVTDTQRCFVAKPHYEAEIVMTDELGIPTRVTVSDDDPCTVVNWVPKACESLRKSNPLWRDMLSDAEMAATELLSGES